MTSSNQSLGLLIARLSMAAIFVISGVGKLGDPAGFAGYLASGGLPAILAWPAILFEIFAGLALIVGFQARLVALALGLFSLVSGILYHTPTDPAQMTSFLKNLAMFGGFIALALTGPGKLSLDGKSGR